MKFNIKTVVGVAVAALVASAMLLLPVLEAQAQPNPGTSIVTATPHIKGGNGPWTNRIAGATSVTNTTPVYRVPPSASSLEIQISFAMTAGGTTNQTFYIEKSVNGTDWVTVSPIAVAAAGTSTATVITNIPATVLAPNFRFPVITNAFATGGHYMTNFSITVSPRY